MPVALPSAARAARVSLQFHAGNLKYGGGGRGGGLNGVHGSNPRVVQSEFRSSLPVQVTTSNIIRSGEREGE